MRTTIIKAGHFIVPTNGMYSLDLRDISKQAAGLLEAARLEAQRILQESKSATEAERQRVMQAAHREGYEQGLAKGRETGHSEALEEARKQFTLEQSTLLGTLSSLLNEFTGSRERLFLEARQDVVVLSIALASRLLSKLNEIDGVAPAMAVEACGQALDAIGEATEVVVRAHPDDVVAIEQFCKDLDAGLKSSRHVRVRSDPSIARGGVVVGSADASIDAGLPSRLDRMADELASGWKSRSGQLGIPL